MAPTSMEDVERERAVDHLVHALRAEHEANPDFPKLSDAAMRDLAAEVVARNGYGNYQRNEHDAMTDVLTDSDRWEYYGAAGKLRRFFKRIFIKTEEVSEWRRNRSNH